MSNPTVFLAVVISLNAGALMWLGWQAYHSYRHTQVTTKRSLRVEYLRGIIVHLDEKLSCVVVSNIINRKRGEGAQP
jgi:hypothetical protein